MTFLPDLFPCFISPFHLPFVLSSIPCQIITKCQQFLQQGKISTLVSPERESFPPVPWIIVTSSFVSSAHEVVPLTHNAIYCCGLGTKGNIFWLLEASPTTVTHLAEGTSQWNWKVGERFVKCHRVLCVDQWDYLGPSALALWTASTSARQLGWARPQLHSQLFPKNRKGKENVSLYFVVIWSLLWLPDWGNPFHSIKAKGKSILFPLIHSILFKGNRNWLSRRIFISVWYQVLRQASYFGLR